MTTKEVIKILDEIRIWNRNFEGDTFKIIERENALIQAIEIMERITTCGTFTKEEKWK